MSLDIPTFSLIFDPEDTETGVYAVSIVDEPAMGYSYEKFSKQTFSIENEEKRILTGVVMLADTPIYRYNERVGEHYVVFSKNTVRKLMQHFYRNNYHGNSNLNHDDESILHDVYFYESFQIDKERGINPPEKYKDVPDGSWFATMKIEDDETWQQVKDGSFTGFSVEGIFNYTQADQEIEAEYSEIKNLLDDIDGLLEKLDSQ